MKTLIATLTLALAAGAGSSLHAQSGAAPGAVLGAIAGGLIGGHNNDNWAAGAALGGVAGALIGSAVTQGEQYPVYGYAPGYSTYGQPVYGQAPVVYGQPAPQVVYAQPNVVYAPAPVYGPAPVYCPPPVSFGVGVYSGPRYYGRGYVAPRCYAPSRYAHGYERGRGWNGRGREEHRR